ncbi:MAG: thioesterase domain-containing protein, partial [Acidobacteriota bacterium]
QAARSQASDGGAARASAQATGDRATDGATDAGAGVSGTGASGAGTSGAGPGTSGAGGARGGGDGGSEPILILKPSGRRPPLFLVAPMFGSAFQYHQLARCLDPDQPVYGLQSPVLHGGTAPETIPEIAASYVRTIRRRWPAGPYCVGGHSFGGWAAFEIARQLRAAGETVAFVGILGTCAPPALAAPLHAHALEQMAQWLRDHADLQRDTALGDAARVAWHQAASTPLQQAASANAAAALRYLPRPYEGDLSLFLTADLTSPFDHTLGWWLLATREIDVAVHSGNHLSTFTEPHVQDLARHLDAALRRAAAPTTAATRSPS